MHPRLVSRDQEVAPSWHVVHVRYGRELAVAALLEQNFQLNVQLLEVLQRRHGKLVKAALFPGYLLVTGDNEHGEIDQIDHTPGCGRLVRMGRCFGAAPAEPVQVPGDQVAQLCGRVETINAAGGLPAHNLHAGQPVQILRGPLQGLDAVFLGPLTLAARVQVLLQFLGRQQQVEVDVNAIEPSTVLKRPRRTRGHGRRIGSYEQVAANL